MNEKVKDMLVSILFIIIIFGLGIVNIIVKDNEISQSERRKLKQFPRFTLENITSGNYIDEVENYIMDQFILRDENRSIKTFIRLNVFCQEENNGFFKVDNTIYKLDSHLNDKSVLNMANKINEMYSNFLDESNSVYYTVVPDKSYFLPEGYLKLDYNRLNMLLRDNINNNIKYIDIYGTLSKEAYYSTDAHWSQDKILNTSRKISQEMGFFNRINTECLVEEYKNFYGTYYGQLADNSISEDRIKYYTNDIIESAKVYNYETNKETKIYDIDKFESSMDKYEFFLSGSAPLLKITNGKNTDNNTLIVFRDSFGSSIIPLFTEAYSTIYLVDTRYIAPQLLSNYMDFENADVLFIYSTLVINQSGSLK